MCIIYWLLFYELSGRKDGFRLRRSLHENNEEEDFEINFIIPKLRKFLQKQTNATFHQEIKQILKNYFQEFPPVNNLCEESKGLENVL